MASGNDQLELRAGRLTLRLDNGGRIVGLCGLKPDRDHTHTSRYGCLITAQPSDDAAGRIEPVAMQHQRLSPTRTRLTFAFSGPLKVVLEADELDAYLRLRVIEITPPDALRCLLWGPVSTSMEGPLGEYLGVVREGSSVIGLMSLSMNTDGRGDCHFKTAHWHPPQDGGSYLELETWDWSRGRAQVFFASAVASKGVPGATITGSGAALYGCDEDQVLTTIEAIERAEGLPHPMIDGAWAKRSVEGWRSSWWTDYTEENIDRCLDLVVESGFRWLCRFRTFGNWGHFEPDPNLYPSGLAGFNACTDKARARGVHTLFYTLSTFLKEISTPEPYISPVPDGRLQTVLPETSLARDMGSVDVELHLVDGPGVLDMLRAPHMEVKRKVLRIDDELIAYESVEVIGGRVVLRGCERGFYRTAASPHPAGRRVVRMLFTYWDCFFPGDEEMNAEVGRRVGELARSGGFKQVTLDGHEGCGFTGHGAYSFNVFLDAIYNTTRDDGFLYTSSSLGNWGWHALSYISWGEYDLHKGFRGGMLDYRLWRMIQLRSNVMPRRFGQHYPDRHTSLEDIEWLMALAAGWDAGVELHVAVDDFNLNPHRREIVEKIRLWEEARLAGAFSPRQKRDFRQTDRLHTLSRGTAGAWRVDFVRRWRHEPLDLLAASSATITPGPHAAVAPCSASFDWTHDPGIYKAAWLSDDMIHTGGDEPARWELTPPWTSRQGRAGHELPKLQFLLRLSAGAPGPIRNPRIIINEDAGTQLRLPVVLHPGQYVSTPHDMPMAYVYDRHHGLVDEVPIRDLPAIPEGPIRLSLAVEGHQPHDAGLVFNLRTHQHIPAP